MTLLKDRAAPRNASSRTRFQNVKKKEHSFKTPKLSPIAPRTTPERRRSKCADSDESNLSKVASHGTMGRSSWFQRVRNAALIGSLCLRCALASPQVNVALKASFPSPPLLIELL